MGGFRQYWRWKSRPHGERPRIKAETARLIRRISVENPLWGAPRIHGELLKLGFEVARSSVAKNMVKRRRPQVGNGARSLRITAGRRRDGFVRRAEIGLAPALCLHHYAARP